MSNYRGIAQHHCQKKELKEHSWALYVHFFLLKGWTETINIQLKIKWNPCEVRLNDFTSTHTDKLWDWMLANITVPNQLI